MLPKTGADSFNFWFNEVSAKIPKDLQAILNDYMRIVGSSFCHFHGGKIPNEIFSILFFPHINRANSVSEHVKITPSKFAQGVILTCSLGERKYGKWSYVILFVFRPKIPKNLHSSTNIYYLYSKAIPTAAASAGIWIAEMESLAIEAIGEIKGSIT